MNYSGNLPFNPPFANEIKKNRRPETRTAVFIFSNMKLLSSFLLDGSLSSSQSRDRDTER